MSQCRVGMTDSQWGLWGFVILSWMLENTVKSWLPTPRWDGILLLLYSSSISYILSLEHFMGLMKNMHLHISFLCVCSKVGIVPSMPFRWPHTHYCSNLPVPLIPFSIEKKNDFISLALFTSDVWVQISNLRKTLALSTRILYRVSWIQSQESEGPWGRQSHPTSQLWPPLFSFPHSQPFHPPPLPNPGDDILHASIFLGGVIHPPFQPCLQSMPQQDSFLFQFFFCSSPFLKCCCVQFSPSVHT